MWHIMLETPQLLLFYWTAMYQEKILTEKISWRRAGWDRKCIFASCGGNANSTESLAEIGFFFQNKPFAAIETSVKVTVEYNANNK